MSAKISLSVIKQVCYKNYEFAKTKVDAKKMRD